jgi:hypothetical protein
MWHDLVTSIANLITQSFIVHTLARAGTIKYKWKIGPNECLADAPMRVNGKVWRLAAIIIIHRYPDHPNLDHVNLITRPERSSALPTNVKHISPGFIHNSDERNGDFRVVGWHTSPDGHLGLVADSGQSFQAGYKAFWLPPKYFHFPH